MTSPFTVGIIQDHATADTAANLARAERLIRDAAGRGAQIVCLSLVVGRLYGRDLFAEILQLVAGLLCTLSLVSAIALGLAGR